MLYKFAEAAGLNIYSPCDGGSFSSDYGIWKHLRFPICRSDAPRLQVSHGYRVIYMVSNPFNAIYSLFRRGFQVWALDRLQVEEDQRQKFHEAWSLEDYLANGEDLLGIEDHVRNWTERPIEKDYPILVMKYECLEPNRDVLLDFMDVPDCKRQLFPKIVERKSDFHSLSVHAQRNMRKMYGCLVDYFASLPDFFYR